MASPLPLSDAEYEILTQAYEDLNGLWEAAWGLRSYVFPDRSDDELRQVAEAILKRFLEQGWITFERQQRGHDRSLPVPTSEVPGLLADPQSWEPPGLDDWYLGFLATDEGTRVWNEEARRRQLLVQGS